MRQAEQNLAQAHAQEVRAENEFERAVEELEEAEHDKPEWVIVNGRRKEVDTPRLEMERKTGGR